MVGPEFPIGKPPARDPNLPASGAWRQSDPPANRQFATVCDNRCFALEGGGVLDRIDLAYETWGTLNAAGDNAVLVCHALTGDAHAAGPSGPGQATEGWWDQMIGPGRPLDSARYFVVCINVLGGCGGSTGPSSLHPGDGKPYGARFPVVSIRDSVRTQALLADQLGVDSWLCVIGGSMGGMQVLEWGVMFPNRVRSMAVIASTVAASPLQIGWSQVGRLAITNDHKWNNGNYYEAGNGEGPTDGLTLARRIAQIHYRSDASFEKRFGRSVVDRLDQFNLWDRFQVESYLDYHGSKLARRFDANTYLILNKAMDLHDIGRDRGGVDMALGRIQCPSLVASIDSDMLYTPRQQEALRDGLAAHGLPVNFEVIESIHGHDGFLIEFDQVGPMIDRFVSDRFKL